MSTTLQQIEQKITNGQRLSKSDGLALFACPDLARVGALADRVRQRLSGDYVYYNVNCHVNLTNICTSRCDLCAFGCDADAPQAYAMTLEQVRAKVQAAARDPELSGLHIVSGLHPDWPFSYYVSIIRMLKQEFPQLHLKGFTGVEIMHFVKLSGLTIREVLQTLIDAGLEAMPGGGAEILKDEIHEKICPKKATPAEWLEVARTAHQLGLKTNASMLYGHIESCEDRIDHLLKLRALQDETGGFQTFIPFPFLPGNTKLGQKVPQRTSYWDDLRTMAVSRLMLDNFPNIKAYWVMLTLPIAQLALGFGANDIDGTIQQENIMHATGSKAGRALSKETIIRTIREAGRIPAECDCNFHIIRTL